MKLHKLAGLLPLLYAAPVLAIQPFTVKDIRVEGIQRTEAGTVFSYLPVKVGEQMNDEKAAAAIRALYATGFFKDVRIEVEQGVLVVLVRERPSIASVEINGVKEFPKDQLRTNLKLVGLSEGRILDRSMLDKAEQELKRQYVARGKYAVTVKTRTTQMDRNRVAVSFDVTEGDTAKIKQINIVGCKVYPESELQDLMKLDTSDWMSWFSKNDQYSKEKLSADLETLRSYYLDSGYLEFNINSTQVSITPDKKDIYITVNITEGPQYRVSEVKLTGGENVVPHDELAKLVTLKAGDVFSRKELTKSTGSIGDRMGDEGYAFANVGSNPEVDKEKHQVAFNITVDPGQRVYVRRINVSGNTKTRDEVVRREFRQMEGAWFAAGKVKKSKQRLDRLGFFSETSIDAPPVQGTADQMDVNVSVKEKPTGSVSVGAGYSSNEGIVLSGSVTQSNIFGSGNYLSTQLNTGRINQVYSVSYTNPYYTDDGMSRGFDVYKKRTNTTNTNYVTQYNSSTIGGALRYGLPISDDDTVTYGVAAERTFIGLTPTSPLRFVNYVNLYGTTNSSLSATVGWTHDTRDSAMYPTQGVWRQSNFEWATPAMTMRYVKAYFQNQWFYPLAKDVTFMLNGEVGAGTGYGGKTLPFFKSFYAGGIGSVRGYYPNSLGPKDANGFAVGGDRKLVGNAEVLFPMPGMGKDTALRLSAFVDGGVIYGKLGQGIIPGVTGPRYSTGVALTWVSPMGPIKLSWAKPLNKQPGDNIQNLQFTIGTLF